MKDGEFSLRKWNSNCQSFRDKIKQDEEKKAGQLLKPFPKEVKLHKISIETSYRAPKMVNWKQNN